MSGDALPSAPALDHKDAAAVAASGGKAGALLPIVRGGGRGRAGAGSDRRLDLAPGAGAERVRLAVVSAGSAAHPSRGSPSIRSRIAASNITPASASRFSRVRQHASSGNGPRRALSGGGRRAKARRNRFHALYRGLLRTSAPSGAAALCAARDRPGRRRACAAAVSLSQPSSRPKIGPRKRGGSAAPIG